MIDVTTTILTNTNNKALNLLTKTNSTLNSNVEISEKLTTKEILNNFIYDLANNKTSKETILSMLKHSPIFQNMGTFANDLKLLITSLKSEANISELITLLKSLNIDMENVTKQNISLLITSNIRDILISLQSSLNSKTVSTDIFKSIDKLIFQIDYYELLSYVDNGNYLYLPYSWKELEKGSFYVKKQKEESYFVEIDLKFIEYGELKVMMLLEDKNKISISMFVQKEDLKNKIKDEMSNFRKVFNSKNIILEQLQIFDKENSESNKVKNKYLELSQYL